MYCEAFYLRKASFFLSVRSHPISLPVSSPGKGGKNRRRGKNENEETKRELEFKEAGQEYAQASASACTAFS